LELRFGHIFRVIARRQAARVDLRAPRRRGRTHGHRRGCGDRGRGGERHELLRHAFGGFAGRVGGLDAEAVGGGWLQPGDRDLLGCFSHGAVGFETGFAFGRVLLGAFGAARCRGRVVEAVAPGFAFFAGVQDPLELGGGRGDFFGGLTGWGFRRDGGREPDRRAERFFGFGFVVGNHADRVLRARGERFDRLGDFFFAAAERSE